MMTKNYFNLKPKITKGQPPLATAPKTWYMCGEYVNVWLLSHTLHSRKCTHQVI